MQPVNDNSFCALTAEQVFYLADVMRAMANAARADADAMLEDAPLETMKWAHQMGASTGILAALSYIVKQQTNALEVKNAQSH